MQNLNLISNGVIRVPVGYRFYPTDEELIVHYLKKKVNSLPFPASIIPEFDAFSLSPTNLPGNLNERRYFFSKRREIKKKCRVMFGSGYWKRTKKNVQILDSKSNQVIGIKKKLVFYGENSSSPSKGYWVMQEYNLVGNKIEDDWVVCLVFFKKKAKPTRNRVSSSCSSAITEASSYGSDHEEVNSCT
ncbi:NAC domain [Dillenia turbinata]|uniref:NAC domain n=1 Tax=Dillenia turbinata TaxID=194707 RepID=A0AAN8UJI4_9MAGN